MSKKLLEENTIRQFMKLANIETNTTSNFLKENFDEKLNKAEESSEAEKLNEIEELESHLHNIKGGRTRA